MGIVSPEAAYWLWVILACAAAVGAFLALDRIWYRD